MKEAKKAMKAYIHTHNNPEIPYPMAAYREPKPDKEPYTIKANVGELREPHFYNTEYQEALKEHLAYIKEPGWKEGDKFYYDGNKLQSETIGKGELKDFIEYLKNRNLSHYHEGQEIDLEKFRYVREDKRPLAIDADRLDDGEYMAKIRKTQWQEVKEPRKIIRNKRVKIGDSHNQGYNAIVEGKVDITNPEWEQFQKGCRKATILLEETEQH